MIWLGLSKIIVAAWVGYGMATEIKSVTGKLLSLLLAAMLGQIAAFDVGYILLWLRLGSLSGADVYTSFFSYWVSISAATAGVLIAHFQTD